MEALDPEAFDLTLDVAGRLFVPPRSRAAMDRLYRRGVLRCVQAEGRVLTSYAALQEYATAPQTRGAILRPIETLGHIPTGSGQSLPDEGEERLRAMGRLVEQLAIENARLRVEIEELHERLQAH